MPPRPFKPPRPSAPQDSRPKSKAKPKSKTPTGIKKRSPTKSKRKSPATDTRRDSGRSLGLPSLSPDSSLEIIDDADESPVEDDDDPFASQQPARKEKEKEGRGPREEVEEIREHAIPEDLLNVLLHSHFKGETRVKKDACAAIGRYMETFIREGVARCIWAGSGEEGGGGMLEVEDLEKLAPQLLMDF